MAKNTVEDVIAASILKTDEMVDAVARALVIASTTFRPDQIRRYEALIESQTESGPRWALSRVLENSRAAQVKKIPLCNDTGIPHIFIDVGEKAVLPTGFFKNLNQGIAEGLRRLPGRPMGVKGDDIQRIIQSEGLFETSEGVLPAPPQIRNVAGDDVKVTILMLGGGPEIQGKTMRVFHKHSIDTVVDEMIAWAKTGVPKLGCTPATMAYGVGRTQVEAAALSLEAMRDANFDQQSEMEARITRAVNETGVGPLGLGGSSTVLGTFIKVGPQRASGIRVVSLRVGCCYDPRKATVLLTQ